MDEARGEVVIVGSTAGKIPGPSAIGAGPSLPSFTATGQGRAERSQPGRLARQGYGRLHCGGWFRTAQPKVWSKARDPQRRAKFAAARRGWKMPKALLRKLVALSWAVIMVVATNPKVAAGGGKARPTAATHWEKNVAESNMPVPTDFEEACENSSTAR